MTADKDDISYTDFVTRLVRAQGQASMHLWRIVPRGSCSSAARLDCPHTS